eukprot:2839591-Amphidinium_carterae.1
MPPRLLVPVLAHVLEHLGTSTMACRELIQSDAAAGGNANGKERVLQTPEEIDDGLRYIQNAGPTNPSDGLPWALTQQMFGNGESGDGPLVGWNLGWNFKGWKNVCDLEFFLSFVGTVTCGTIFDDADSA